MLSNEAVGQKLGGQPLLGGLNIKVERNYYGTQLGSFEATIHAPICKEMHPEQSDDTRAVFIRAPGIFDLKLESTLEETV